MLALPVRASQKDVSLRLAAVGDVRLRD